MVWLGEKLSGFEIIWSLLSLHCLYVLAYYIRCYFVRWINSTKTKLHPIYIFNTKWFSFIPQLYTVQAVTIRLLRSRSDTQTKTTRSAWLCFHDNLQVDLIFACFYLYHLEGGFIWSDDLFDLVGDTVKIKKSVRSDYSLSVIVKMWEFCAHSRLYWSDQTITEIEEWQETKC